MSLSISPWQCSRWGLLAPSEVMISLPPLLQVCDRWHLFLLHSWIYLKGSAISWDGDFKHQTEGEKFSAVIDLLLNCSCFVYIGAWLPFTSYNDPALGMTPWRLVVLLLCILILRRIPFLLLLYKLVPEVEDWRQALFAGHFGTYFHLICVLWDTDVSNRACEYTHCWLSLSL